MQLSALALALCLAPLSAAEEPTDGGVRSGTAGLGFIENLGQFDPPVRFVVRSRGLIAQIADDAVHWNLMSPRGTSAPRPGRERGRNPEREREVTAPRCG